MSNAPAFAYVQARLQAHHARFLDQEGWQRLEAAPGYELFLKQARLTSLDRWLQALPSDASPMVEASAHAVERWLSERFQHHVDEVAGWMPKAWRPALHWLKLLPLLPALRHLLDGHPPLPWMAKEPLLSPMLGSGSLPLPLPDPTPFLAMARKTPSLLEAWTAHWRLLWPSGVARASLEEMTRLFMGHLEGFPKAGSSEAAWKARHLLGQSLTMGFRRHGGTPTAGFIHLALTALELERLRGALVRRLLFVPGART